MKYLVFCLVGTAIALNACSAPMASGEYMENKMHPDCAPMKQEIELMRNRLATAAPAEKERLSAELVHADRQFTQWCPVAAKSMKTD
jgi:hypothetical protein